MKPFKWPNFRRYFADRAAATRPATLLAFCVGTLALTACSTPETQRFQTDPSKPQTAETVRTIYANRTLLTHGPHGTQVEYHDENGISHLWYPGNRRGVPARWTVRMGRSGHDICWKYPSSSYNPLTRQQGGRWECTPDRFYYPGLKQIIAGDPFGLDSGRVPFALPRGRFLAEDLAVLANIPRDRVRIIYRAR